nr:MAG TPA: hypothetical protein [Caudoviricetes sp.]
MKTSTKSILTLISSIVAYGLGYWNNQPIMYIVALVSFITFLNTLEEK